MAPPGIPNSTMDFGLKKSRREALKWRIIFWTFEGILFFGGIAGLMYVFGKY